MTEREKLVQQMALDIYVYKRSSFDTIAPDYHGEVKAYAEEKLTEKVIQHPDETPLEQPISPTPRRKNNRKE